MNTNVTLRESVSLPITSEAMAALRKLKSKPSINDEVESIVLALLPDEKFRQFIEAIYDEESVEGSLYIDDVEAAIMVRDFAIEENRPLVATAKLKTVRRALLTALNRYGVGRNSRRQTLDEAGYDPNATSGETEGNA